MAQPLLEVQNLNIAFDTERGQIRPVRDVSFTIYPGQTVAVVGESGCGKSVTSLAILRLIPQPPGRILGGKVLLNGRDLLSQATGQGGAFQWWLAVFPGVAIFLTVFSYNLIGEALRDAIDPRLREGV